MASNWVLKPSQFALLPCHSISFHCSSGLLLLVFCCISLSELYRKGIELPDPEEMLGNLDKVGGDPNDGTPCLRATAAHAQFLFLFAKTVVVASVFKKYKSTRLLSSYMTSCLEAFAVLTYTNSYDTWMQEAARKDDEMSAISDNSPSTASKRRFTEKTRGTGKFKGWTDSGIDLYNLIDETLEEQRKDPSLMDFDTRLKTWFLQGNRNDSPQQDTGRQKKRARNNLTNFAALMVGQEEQV